MKRFAIVLVIFGLIFALPLAGAAEEEERMGAWVDKVVITREGNPEAAVSKLESGDSDIYGRDEANPGLFNRVAEHPELDYEYVTGGSSEFMLNIYGPEFEGSGEFNPFYSARLREALNWLVDRQYISDEILGGLGNPLWTIFTTTGPEQQERYPELVAEIEEYYSYDPEKAEEVIGEEMRDMGAQMVDGTWRYEGDPVEITLLIRKDLDPYPEAGDYFANQLEDVGFKTERLYRTFSEASPVVFGSPPKEGKWQVYTGGWGMTVFSREEVNLWNQLDTHRVMGLPCWTYLEEPLEENFPEFSEIADILYNRNFNSLEERRELVETALWKAKEWSTSIWHTEPRGILPHRKELGIVLDGAAGVGAQWAHTIHFKEDGEPAPGGTVRMELPTLMADPWNPVDGSSATYDNLINNDGIGEGLGHMPNANNGLYHPNRYERAEVTVNEDLPVESTLDHVELTKVEEIEVPDDAWYDWDAEEQEWITVGEAEEFQDQEKVTARRKSVVYYPEDLWDQPLHDGSTISIADFVMSMIVSFDRAKEESEIFDESTVAGFEGFHDAFKGIRIRSEDPLVIETYSDTWYLDAELNVSTWWPSYGTYDWDGFWHNIAVGTLAEAERALAFSEDKAEKLNVEWMDYTKGPSLPILEANMREAINENYIPYEPTLGEYITEEEASERWSNLESWYEEMGHFWVDAGPLYLEDVSPTAEIVELSRFEDYPYPADRWLFMNKKNE